MPLEDFMDYRLKALKNDQNEIWLLGEYQKI